MAIKYKMQVINITTYLHIRSGAGTQYSVVGKLKNGNTFVANDTKKAGNITWYKIEGKNQWVAGNSTGGTKYLKIVANMGSAKLEPLTPGGQLPPKGNTNNVNVGTSHGTKYDIKDGNKLDGLGIPKDLKGKEGTQSDINWYQRDKNQPLNDRKYGYSGEVWAAVGNSERKMNENNAKAITESENLQNVQSQPANKVNTIDGVKYKSKSQLNTFYTITDANYPNVIGDGKEIVSVDYKFTIDEDIKKAIKVIKEVMNVPTAYTRDNLNIWAHRRFNRFRMGFPDVLLKNTTAAIFFTRPDLNIFNKGSSIVNSQIMADPRDYYILKNDIDLGRALVADGGGSTDANSTTKSPLRIHNFNPFLSNFAQSLEIQDDSVDTIETGETFTGFKMQYSKHNNKSVTAGQMSIKFAETFNLGVTNMHQLWVDYQSNVYKGVYSPKIEHIWRKELDYACDIYYFLLDQDGETILFWSKYYGCFPVNVPKSTFSYDSGSQVSFPEVSVTYNYIYKSDLNPRTLVEFNHDGGDSTLSYKYIPIYAGDINDIYSMTHCAKTWAGIPYISSEVTDVGQLGISSYRSKDGKNDKITLSPRHSTALKLRYRRDLQ